MTSWLYTRQSLYLAKNEQPFLCGFQKGHSDRLVEIHSPWGTQGIDRDPLFKQASHDDSNIQVD
jgi:hypothetical protein